MDDPKPLEEYLDKKYPRMKTPDREGIDLHPADPRRRFIAVEEGAEFEQADPLTDEDLAELERLKKSMKAGK